MSANCMASPGSIRSKLRQEAAPPAACRVAQPSRGRTWCCPSTSSCKKWWKIFLAHGAVPWRRWTPTRGRCWPLSASPLSTPTCLSMALMSKIGKCSMSPLTSHCSTVPCVAPIRQDPPTNPSWPWPPCRPASAVPAPSSTMQAPGLMGGTLSAATATLGWGRSTWFARLCCPAMCTTTRWPMTWGLMPYTTS